MKGDRFIDVGSSSSTANFPEVLPTAGVLGHDVGEASSAMTSGAAWVASDEERHAACVMGGMATILLVIVILMVLGALPTWPYSREWGYGPSGGLGLILAILLILVFLGRV
jgi:hypothetical protein